MLSMSRLFVGSSSSSASGSPNSACASSTRTLRPPGSSLITFSWSLLGDAEAGEQRPPRPTRAV